MATSVTQPILDYAPARRGRRLKLVLLAAVMLSVGLATAAWLTRPQRPALPYLTGLAALRASITQPDQPPVPRGKDLLLLSHSSIGEYVVVYGGPAPDPNMWMFLEV